MVRITCAFALCLLLRLPAFAGVMYVPPHEEGHNDSSLFYDEVPGIMYPYYQSTGQTQSGFSTLRVLTHEIGHAIGLAHAWNDQEYVIGPTAGKWGSPEYGTGATITWSLMPTGTSAGSRGTITSLLDLIPTGGIEEIRQAFHAWELIANVHFVEMPDFGVPFGMDYPGPNIRIGAASLGSPLAIGYYPNGPYGYQGNYAGDILFNKDVLWNIGSSPIPFGFGDIAGAQNFYGASLLEQPALQPPSGTTPEPSTLALALFACVIGIVYSVRRKRATAL